MLFAAAADRLGAREYARGLAAGLGYGVVLWVLTAGLLLPVWLDAVGAATELSLPYLDTTSLIGHLVYGAVLGLVYAALRRWPGASRA